MDLEETETRNDCAGEAQQQFNRSKRTSQKVCRQTEQSETEAAAKQSHLVEAWEAEEPSL
jgi:hypothetical protein